MATYTVTISAQRRASAYQDKRHAWRALAELGFSIDGDFALKGSFLNLAPKKLTDLSRFTDVSLEIDDERYGLVMVEPDGTFVALKDLQEINQPGKTAQPES